LRLRPPTPLKLRRIKEAEVKRFKINKRKEGFTYYSEALNYLITTYYDGTAAAAVAVW
jgi:hypothetical protein